MNNENFYVEYYLDGQWRKIDNINYENMYKAKQKARFYAKKYLYKTRVVMIEIVFEYDYIQEK